MLTQDHHRLLVGHCARECISVLQMHDGRYLFGACLDDVMGLIGAPFMWPEGLTVEAIEPVYDVTVVTFGYK